MNTRPIGKGGVVGSSQMLYTALSLTTTAAATSTKTTTHAITAIVTGVLHLRAGSCCSVVVMGHE